MLAVGSELAAALRRRLSLGLLTVGLALAIGAGWATATALAGSPSLHVTLNTAHPGYVSATISGPPKATVTLSEADSAGQQTLSSATIGPKGTVTVPDLLIDSCTVRDRGVTAATSGSGTTPLTATATITTPKCTTRLDPTIPTSGRMGRSVALRLGDRWLAGDLPVRVCVQPPGGRTSCGTYTIAAGQPERILQLSLPRIGGWQVTTSVPGGRVHQSIVWASHPGPIRMLAIGDSEMQVLDDDLAADLAPYGVKVISNARPSTGLTNSFFYNWQSTAAQMVAHNRPDISVVSMGANDGYSIGDVDCCGPDWATAYGKLVTRMAQTLMQGPRAIALWFVLATPRPADFQRSMSAVNAGIEDAAHTLAGRMGLVNANAYFTPGNVYRNYMVVNGHGFTIHESDGIHLNATADTYAALLVVDELKQDRLIR